MRGDLVDVFPTTGREPVRIELFGDDVERLSAFSTLTQRSLRDLEAVTIQPAGDGDEGDVAERLGDEGPHLPEGLVEQRVERPHAFGALSPSLLLHTVGERRRGQVGVLVRDPTRHRLLRVKWFHPNLEDRLLRHHEPRGAL